MAAPSSSDEDDAVGGTEGDESDDSDCDDSSGSSKDERVVKLKQDIAASPHDLQLHVALIGSLREAADLDRVRQAREDAAKYCALPECVWLEWIQDEQNLLEIKHAVEHLDQLYGRACDACPLSSRIWLQRCALHCNNEQKPVARAIYENALSNLGLHPFEGPQIWGAYRDYEESVLLKVSGAAYEEQVQVVRSLYMRQLSLPLPGSARVREAYGTFESSLELSLCDTSLASKADSLVVTAEAGWHLREELEQRLLDASRPMVTTASAGIIHDGPAEISAELLAAEETSGDVARITLGHLRATHWAPHEEERWHRFSDFVSKILKDDCSMVALLERATRSCPFSKCLWQNLHSAQEGSGMGLDGLQELVERGVAALGFDAHELLLQHADACRRCSATSVNVLEMRTTLQRAVKLTEGEEGTCCAVLLHWMRLEAYVVGDAKAVLDVGNRLALSWGSCYNFWSGFIAAVRHCRSPCDSYVDVERLYQRAIVKILDYPSQIRADYIQFERECGNLQSWLDAKRQAEEMVVSCEAGGQDQTQPMSRKRSKRVQEKRGSVEAADKVHDGATDSPKVTTVDGQSFDVGLQNQLNEPSTDHTTNMTRDGIIENSEKEALPKLTPGTAGGLAGPDDGCAEIFLKDDNRVLIATAIDDENGCTDQLAVEVQTPDKSYKGSHYLQKQLAAGRAVPTCPEEEGEHTVYVSNLDWSVDERRLHDLFSIVPGLLDVRLVKNFLKKSKGYAYIDYASPEQVKMAVDKLNGTVIHQRKINVAPSLPTKALYEERTVFVENLSSAVTQEEIRMAFTCLGEVVDVRIPTGSGDAPRGHAYVEFAEPCSVEKALRCKDVIIGGCSVLVSRSIPIKDHRMRSAPSVKGISQRCNQRMALAARQKQADPVAQAAQHTTTVFVKNLAFSVDDASLNSHFSTAGHVQQAFIVRNAVGRSRGFGFVEFGSAEDAQSALMLNDSILCDREILVSASQRAITQKKSQGELINSRENSTRWDEKMLREFQFQTLIYPADTVPEDARER